MFTVCRGVVQLFPKSFQSSAGGTKNFISGNKAELQVRFIMKAVQDLTGLRALVNRSMTTPDQLGKERLPRGNAPFVHPRYKTPFHTVFR